MSGSNTVNVHVGSLEDMGKRFIDAWHRAERGEEVNEAHATFHDLPALLAALTPKRLDLLRYVRHHDVRTVKALAADLRRDYKNVHRDVEELTKLGLLARTADRVMAPYAEVDARFVL
jgi:predicted transcriptional regulator